MKRNFLIFFISILSLGFIIWSLSLIVKVNRLQEDIRASVNVITEFTKLEKLLDSYSQNRVYKILDLKDEVDYQDFKLKYIDLRNTIQQISTEDAIYLDSIRLERFFEPERSYGSDDSIKKAKSLLVIEGTADKVQLLKARIGGIRSNMGEISLVLQDTWKLINIMVIIACLMSLQLTIMVYFIRRKNKNIHEQKVAIENKNKEIVSQSLELAKANAELEGKSRQIEDSIKYSSYLQSSVLSYKSKFNNLFPESFIVNLPKDIVSGDFFWFAERSDLAFWALVDCTGHGVPGAMVSMIGNNCLNRAVFDFGLVKPAEILVKVSELIEDSFDSSDHDVPDGMDLALIVYEKKRGRLCYAGANMDIYIKGKANIQVYKSSLLSIGKSIGEKRFEEVECFVEKGNVVYIFTDGYYDQFGGPDNRKFYKANLITLLNNLGDDFSSHKEMLLTNFMNWKGSYKQIDDVTFFGVRL